MIQSKEDLRYYLKEDRKAQHKEINPSFKQIIAEFLFPDQNYEFIKCLRYVEYYTNCKDIFMVGGKKTLLYQKVGEVAFYNRY